MRLIRLGVGLLLVLGLLAGCTSTPSVVTDYDPEYAFGELNRFRVELAEQDDSNSLLISPFTLSHLQRVIESQLASRYQSVDEGEEADFVVRYHIVVEDRLDVRSYDQRYGFGYYGYGPWYRYPYSYGPSPRVYRQGTLIVDIARVEDNKPLWRGVAEQRLYDGLTPQEQRQRLSAAVTEVLSNFPPVR
ncbi:DUF4136 domain-containing protein [Marinimicrobium sp. C6131]|uniref:DUF4136 domain-containing protein n=1 Tax=Marinimicrobium sp. C6131 TaxID=3022676 RepID=UPI00223D9CF4|nr:DUF4136 domain-containing protein [Marinimicrobium sp. C6131]UZJ45744.1 DUF4136 domain-containing protein [Marinimicrobium sp. C6131]